MTRLLANATNIYPADSYADLFQFARSSSGLVSVGPASVSLGANSIVTSMALMIGFKAVFFFATAASPYLYYCVPPIIAGSCTQISSSDIGVSLSATINHVILSQDDTLLYTVDSSGIVNSYSFDFGSYAPPPSASPASVIMTQVFTCLSQYFINFDLVCSSATLLVFST